MSSPGDWHGLKAAAGDGTGSPEAFLDRLRQRSPRMFTGRIGVQDLPAHVQNSLHGGDRLREGGGVSLGIVRLAMSLGQ